MIKAAILGYGFEGKSLFFYLKKKKDFEITILDKNKNLVLPRGANAVLGKNYLKNLSRHDIIFRSPGVPYNLFEIQKVKNKVTSLTKLFFDEAKGSIVGITGSVGKTTTAILLYKILKASGKKTFLAGNVGVNPLPILKKLTPSSITVMELSSFQLQDLTKSPRVAVILDISEEHLDKHKSFKEYLAAKSNLARWQKKSDFAVYAARNKLSKKLARLSPGRKIPVWAGRAKLLGYQLNIPGEYNYRNIMAVRSAAKLFGVPEKIIKKITRNFKGLPHRLEFVRSFNSVRYFNNSKATNPISAVAGIDAFSEKKIILAGGYNKNLNLAPLVRRLLRGDVRNAIFFGSARFELKKLAKKYGLSKFSSAPRLSEALKLAFNKAKPEDVVLLSPGTASFDEFENYEERGRKFKEWVGRLK